MKAVELWLLFSGKLGRSPNDQEVLPGFAFCHHQYLRFVGTYNSSMIGVSTRRKILHLLIKSVTHSLELQGVLTDSN